MELRGLLDGYLAGVRPMEGLQEGIRAMMLRSAAGVGKPNFPLPREDVLSFLAVLMDEAYLSGALGRALEEACNDPLHFRVSTRLIQRSARTTRARRGGERAGFVITLSTLLFVDGLLPGPRGTHLHGRYCEDRLDLVQRVLEHHLLHVAEELAYGKSSCAKERFQDLARVMFGHTSSDEALPSFAASARETLGFGVGDLVAFELDGLPYEGVVERIGKRATVRVEHEDGVAGPDGRTYLRARLPLRLLAPAGERGPGRRGPG